MNIYRIHSLIFYKKGEDKMKKLVTTMVGNRIQYANVSEKTGMITGNKREDVTDNAVAAVFSWFIGNMTTFKDGEKIENVEYSISYKGLPYVLKMVRKEENQEEKKEGMEDAGSSI